MSIDLGRYGASYVTIDGGIRVRGTTDFGDRAIYENEHYDMTKQCPGPGEDEPPCGRLISRRAIRCKSCEAIHRHMEEGVAPSDRIREPPKIPWEERILAELREKKSGKA